MSKNSGELAQLTKLCSHFAGNDSELTDHLLKLSLNFFTSSCHDYQKLDEIYVVEKIRRFLKQTKTDDDLSQFELLYNRLKRATILKNRTAVLTFLLHLSTNHKEHQSWLIMKELQLANLNLKLPSSTSTVNSDQICQKIFTGKFNQSSSTTNTQVTVPSLMWSTTDIQGPLSDTSKSSFSANTISEPELIQELIFSFQGIEGKVLRKEPGSGGFMIDTRAGVSKSQRAIVQRLSELGYLHNQVRQHCDEADKQIGIIGQSLIAALREELTKHYELIAVLQTQLKKPNTRQDNTDLTLRNLLCWVQDYQFKLQWLANLAAECQNKKGGALISSVFAFLQHGSPVVQDIVRTILKAICTPLLRMIMRWILDGFLEDPCGEFFVEARSVVKEERLWHDKYHVRQSMVPSFITMAEARKILVTGKSINFLREVCQDMTSSPERESMLRTFETINVEALFNPELGIQLHKMMDIAFHESSQRVLDIMRREHRLFEHMQAFRNYLLLGQGDFIRYLLELIAPELSKPASQIYPHTLSAILDSAVRVTNAQFENPDTLKRLDVRLVEVSHGDLGWDVFTVLYHIDGPIGTVFEPTLDTYRQLFGALWKAKRMEFVLSSMQKRQITSAKMFRNMQELSPVMQYIHLLTSEMVHFIHQTQYYFLFEVLECSWAEMLTNLDQAECLDDVIKAHWKFLKSIQHGVLLDASSEELCTQLRTIYNIILRLESIEESLYRAANSELKVLASRTSIQHNQAMAGFSITSEDDRKTAERTAKFNNFLNSIKTQISSVAKYYNDHFRKYLSMLSASSDEKLQLLSVRLDFNGFYQQGKPKKQVVKRSRFKEGESLWKTK